MTSQGPGLEIFERLAEWSTEEIEQNIDSILQELLRHVSSDDKGRVLQSVYALLVTCLPSLSLEKANECLLRHALPAAQQLFYESLEGIKLRLSDTSSECFDAAETLSSLLQVVIELLKCMECVLQYIAGQGSVNISIVPSVPKTVALLMLQTFRHCRESESLYCDLFTVVSDVLSALFRQCHQVQCRFFAVLSSSISFDCSVETDIVHLVEVLQVLSEIGEEVMSLDIKTMAEQWKGYAKIIQLYLESIRDRLNIAYPISYLCLDISNKLEQLTGTSKDAKSTSRLLKTTSFILKIIAKLCEQFGSGNGCLRDSHSNLYQLLLTLHKYSPPVLTMQNVEKGLVDDIERNIIVAADPMLTHLVCECDFQKEFIKKCRKLKDMPENQLPHLTLMVSVMKKLSALTAEDKDPWLGELAKTNIVGCLLEILKHSHYELSCEIWLPAVVKSGQSPRSCDLYEFLCCHCAGFILSLNSDQFERVEAIMFDSLMEPFVWPAMFVGDVWSICARAGSSELVLDQVLYLADIVSAFEPASLFGRVDCTVISVFLRRMCSFLGTKGKQMLVEKYPPTKHPLLWYIFGLECLSKEMRETVSQLLVTRATSDVQNFSCSNPNKPSFITMVQGLCGLCAALEISPSIIKSPSDTIVPGVISLWHYACRGDLSQNFSHSENVIGESKWLQNFLRILCRCTEYLVHVMNNCDILQVLNQLARLVKHCGPSLKLSISHILHGLATKTLESTSDQGLICSNISSIFTCLLEDSHPLVKDTALETFEYFAHFTVHESIVPDAVANNVSITEDVTCYLQREIPATRIKVKTLRDYLTFQANVSCEHKCEAKKSRCASPKNSDPPAKKMRLECDDNDLSAFLDDDLLTDFVEKDVTDAVNRIIKDAQYLISQSSYQSLPSLSRTDLKKTVEDLNKFIGL